MKTQAIQDKNGYTLVIEEHMPALVSFRYSGRPLKLSALSQFVNLAFKHLKVLLATCTLTIVFVKLVSLLSRWKIFSALVSGKEILLSSLPWLVQVDQTPSWALWMFCICSVVVLLYRRYPEERLIVMQDYGMQIQSTGQFYLFGGSTRFISKPDLLDILIQEVFAGFQVRFALVIIEANNEQLHVIFERLKPRRDVIETVWRKAQECFYGDEQK